METSETRNLPFIFGAQYYRAPTPEPECWETDLSRMRELGFNHVKYWLQWRWSHRTPDVYNFEDIDRLMDMAHDHGLDVTLTAACDVAPSWVLSEFPDSLPITADGLPVHPYAVCCRQIGGFPGPCLNHTEIAKIRLEFLTAAAKRYASHPAMSMWNVWNEPEQNFPNRHPVAWKLTCFCEHCRRGFIEWLKPRYESLDHLNQVWGRCYQKWDEVELPRSPETVKDFVDFRVYQLSVMTGEAAARIDAVKSVDKNHPVYLHVVPNTMRIFNSMTGVDDFAIAELCDLFASTTNGGAIWPNQLVSAAQGKTCYNVESHINTGQVSLHQRELDLDAVLADLLPQIGAGVTGFLFWQYRPEVLGLEAPAWGMVKPDGTDRPVTRAVREFWEKLSPYKDHLAAASVESAEVAIWKSTRNEIFHFAAQAGTRKLADNVEGYRIFFRQHNIPTRYINEVLLEQQKLDGIKLLILPCCYYLSTEEAEAIDRWVRSGGTLLCDAHLAGYNDTTGRHERTVPGMGLAEKWGIYEDDSTSSLHLTGDSRTQDPGGPDTVVAERIDAGRFFDVSLPGDKYVSGSDTCASLAGKEIVPIGRRKDRTVIASVSVGKGKVFYCGTCLGAGLSINPDGSEHLMSQVMETAGVKHGTEVKTATGILVDILYYENVAAFMVMQNPGKNPGSAEIHAEGTWHGLYGGAVVRAGETVELKPDETELFIRGDLIE